MTILNKIAKRLAVPSLIVLALLLSFRFSGSLGFTAESLGLKARDATHLWGILTVPFVHGNIQHLLGNSIALFSLSVILFFVFENIASRIMLWSWILTGLLMFLFARGEVVHIGASGVVYALIFFIMISGFIVRTQTPATFSIIVLTYYGSSVWGLLPIQEGVSWDGHLAGAVAGVCLALLNKREISRQYPSLPKPDWYYEDGEGIEDEYLKFEEKDNSEQGFD